MSKPVDGLPLAVTDTLPVIQGDTPVLRIASLSKSYGARLAVDNVDLSIADREFVSLLGPSGSGKTTILHMVAGFVRPNSGDIAVDGKSIVKLPSHKRNFGVVFQSYALFPHLTVEDNVAFGLRMRGVAREVRKERVAAILELLGLETHAQAKPGQLSGGQQQRVALARALVIGPRLLLMDEPLAALDRRMRDYLQRYIRSIHRKLGVAVLYVTHDQDEAFMLSDRVAVMSEGRIRQVGTARDLYESPSSLFVANFVGDSNVLECVGSHGMLVLRDSSVQVPLDFASLRDTPPLDGDRLHLVVRPHQLTLLRAESASPGTWGLSGTVTELFYRGKDCICAVTLDPTAQVVEACLPTSAVGDVRLGDRVLVSWERGGGLVLHE